MSVPDASIHELLEGWYAGTLDAAQRDELRARLVADPVLLAEARRAAQQHLLLEAWFDATTPVRYAQAVDHLLDAARSSERAQLIAAVDARIARAPVRRRWSRWALAGAASVALMLTWWWLRPEGDARDHSGRVLAAGAVLGGEQPQAVQWGDGSRADLAAGTRATLGDDAGGKRLVLAAGQIRAEVAPQAQGAFSVAVPQGEVRVVGTRFTVTSAAHATTVRVEQGEVQVRAAGAERTLMRGDAARLTDAGITGLPALGDGDLALLRDHPPTLAWSDRRPIGMFVFGLQNSWPPGNPNGWFEDADLDVRTQEGRAEVRRRLLERVDQVIVQLRRVDAQGVIWWNPEGNRWLGRVGYIGDAARLGQLAPEIDAVADEVMARFAAAGLRTGVIVRPWVLEGDADSLGLREDPAQMRALTERRIAYARSRWGASLFMLMQAYTGWSGRRVPYGDLAAITARHPSVLLIPDQEQLPLRAVAAGWTSSRTLTGEALDPAHALYPGSPRIVYVQHARQDLERNAALTRALAGGAIPLIGLSGTHDPRWDDLIAPRRQATSSP